MFDKIDLYLAIFKELAAKTMANAAPAPPPLTWPTSPAAVTTVLEFGLARGTWLPAPAYLRSRRPLVSDLRETTTISKPAT